MTAADLLRRVAVVGMVASATLPSAALASSTVGDGSSSVESLAAVSSVDPPRDESGSASGGGGVTVRVEIVERDAHPPKPPKPPKPPAPPTPPAAAPVLAWVAAMLATLVPTIARFIRGRFK